MDESGGSLAMKPGDADFAEDLADFASSAPASEPIVAPVSQSSDTEDGEIGSLEEAPPQPAAQHGSLSVEDKDEVARIIAILWEILDRPFTKVVQVGSQLAKKVGKPRLAELYGRLAPGAPYRLRSFLNHIGTAHGFRTFAIQHAEEGSHFFVTRPLGPSDRAQSTFTNKVHSLLRPGTAVKIGVLCALFRMLWPQSIHSLEDFSARMHQAHYSCCTKQGNGIWKLQVKRKFPVQRHDVAPEAHTNAMDSDIEMTAKTTLDSSTSGCENHGAQTAHLAQIAANGNPATALDFGRGSATTKPAALENSVAASSTLSLSEYAKLSSISTFLRDSIPMLFAPVGVTFNMVKNKLSREMIELATSSFEGGSMPARFRYLLSSLIDANLLPGLSMCNVTGGTFQRTFLVRQPTRSERNLRGFRERIHALLPPGSTAEEEIVYQLYRLIWTSDTIPLRSFQRLLLEIHGGCCKLIRSKAKDSTKPHRSWTILSKELAEKTTEWPNMGTALSNPLNTLDGRVTGQTADFNLGQRELPRQIVTDAFVDGHTGSSIVASSRSPSVSGHDAARTVLSDQPEKSYSAGRYSPGRERQGEQSYPRRQSDDREFLRNRSRSPYRHRSRSPDYRDGHRGRKTSNERTRERSYSPDPYDRRSPRRSRSPRGSKRSRSSERSRSPSAERGRSTRSPQMGGWTNYRVRSPSPSRRQKSLEANPRRNGPVFRDEPQFGVQFSINDLVACILGVATALFTPASIVGSALRTKFGTEAIIKRWFEAQHPDERYGLKRLLRNLETSRLLPGLVLEEIRAPAESAPTILFLARKPTAYERRLDRFSDRVHVLTVPLISVSEASLWDMYSRVWIEDQMDLKRFGQLMEGQMMCCQRLAGQRWKICSSGKRVKFETPSIAAPSMAVLAAGPRPTQAWQPVSRKATESPPSLDLTQALAIVRSLPSRLELEDFNTFFFECLDAGAMDVDV